MIRVRVQTTDRLTKNAYFKTLKGAQRFAQKWVGETPEISSVFHYAVGTFGDTKVTCEGTSIESLFPKLFPEPVAVSVKVFDTEDYVEDRPPEDQ